mmetsp:Transcript_8679/g.20064  ORF Transcript_8679/g.20064 Transcript_8679/m.20064 type:complete len:226 (-) Transcript_8679:482-1159(-)
MPWIAGRRPLDTGMTDSNHTFCGISSSCTWKWDPRRRSTVGQPRCTLRTCGPTCSRCNWMDRREMSWNFWWSRRNGRLRCGWRSHWGWTPRSWRASTLNRAWDRNDHWSCWNWHCRIVPRENCEDRSTPPSFRPTRPFAATNGRSSCLRNSFPAWRARRILPMPTTTKRRFLWHWEGRKKRWQHWRRAWRCFPNRRLCCKPRQTCCTCWASWKKASSCTKPYYRC